ncbi:family 1 glycosylhydrolase [Paradesertivirga mongoliensis]|uniref:dTDP-4-dehydrorhamnose reductase n=1 Tax=Paradesertivirga mongoliensis TaxID=2100740 RepID=A0ABW4ZI13_9SPHI|nr:family 1 glycosylhydrolase [Pedobacter mongoliensis]
MSITSDVEVWAGIECTINRVRDSYFDQLNYADHYKRQSDLDLFADLGIKKIRYPILWERHKPEADTNISWDATDRSLNRLKELGIQPIAGLVHHGSGPSYASIETEQFATGLAEFALQVAQKFPWIEYYTPINEPLTTARFCGLYGFWYPHQNTDKDFIRLLMHETKATVLAMRAIRTINPQAKLIQTEDLGKTYSTPLLKYQASFENKRRWLSFDLLLGRVDKEHPLYRYITVKCGVKPEELQFFIDNPCPPDILGFNHYLTSERYIDENLKKYPRHTRGGNGRHKYADVEAVRVDLDEKTGAYQLLREAWDHFKLPMAITEVHLGCTREEQLRWVKEMWDTGNQLKSEGVDMRAITAWAVLGSYGWNKLLTKRKGKYEPGVFDLRASQPRPTALAKLIKSLSTGAEFSHPVLESKGWWRKDFRVLYFLNNIRKISNESKTSQPLLILGKTGTLGNAFARVCELRGIHYQLLDRKDFNLVDLAEMESVIKEKRPWAIVNAAGYVRVDDAETECSNCYTANTHGPANLAILSSRYHFKLLTFSSDLVFDGSKNQSYLESDPVAPLNIYGISKARAEQFVLERDPSALIIRTSAFFGPWDKYNFVTNVLSSLKNQQFVKAASDVLISPTYVPDLVNTSLDLLLDDESGIWHLANRGETTWASLATQVAKLGGFDSNLVTQTPLADFNYPAKRPRYSVLSSERALLMPDLSDSLTRYFYERKVNSSADDLVISTKAG